MPNSVALDRAPRYFGEFLSENIIETPEGYRICKNVVIARTGFQTYKVREIDDPQGLLDGHKPDNDIELWRDPDEVFSDATIASFEGKPITLQHPDEMLDLDNTAESHRGHVQNVRKGKEPLDDGNLPLLADFFVTHPEAVAAIDNGVREVSCGYYYTLAKSGERFDQTNLRGNHIAIVQRARAGDEARIYDAAPEPEKPSIKEKPVSGNWLKNLLGRGLKDFAKDAKPEEVAEAMEEIRKETDTHSTNGHHHSRRSRARDAESASPSASASDAASYSASASAEPAKDDDVLKHPETAAPKSAFDAAHRKRLHDALDAVIEEHAKKAADDAGDKDKDGKGKDAPSLDAELQELKDLFGKSESASSSASDQGPTEEEEELPAQFSDSGSASGEPGEDAGEREGEEAEVVSEDQEEEEEEEEAGDESKPIVREEPILKPGDRQKKAFDSSSARFARKVLIRLKPFVAQAKDAKLERAFDTAYRGLRKMEKAGTGKGSYERVREVTRHTTAADESQQSPAEKDAATYEAEMKKRMTSASEQFKALAKR